MISINGGKIKANVDELTLPTNDITAPKLGTMAAKRTKKFGKNLKLYLIQAGNVFATHCVAMNSHVNTIGLCVSRHH